jgi:AraC family transcriptional regulator of adaptative response/methylated-DNA-[protein]-cysteine methyltransferase
VRSPGPVSCAALVGGDERFERLVARVVGFVEAPGSVLDLPLDVQGTAFQQRVWQALREIPPGTTVSYAEMAARSARRRRSAPWRRRARRTGWRWRFPATEW